ncbi:Hypothetical protein ORPV_743 [Orpheovirus IHUMI-LCC2]|uniref:F-box domain-containing protein n=1 Tax=Orpheovirus IHUMI-LCC2 TaxID=2023057 RepID=A0A2I2L545_9VIRU|nr:Hypothetical protein ORPV_743 [Orpheovirus IHUMI-LCC2]SNW62647.1 Hypothetical protein ORPV_743 [Orpheovirus IHUMI-LCC2]
MDLCILPEEIISHITTFCKSNKSLSVIRRCCKWTYFNTKFVYLTSYMPNYNCTKQYKIWKNKVMFAHGHDWFIWKEKFRKDGENYNFIAIRNDRLKYHKTYVTSCNYDSKLEEYYYSVVDEYYTIMLSYRNIKRGNIKYKIYIDDKDIKYIHFRVPVTYKSYHCYISEVKK